MALVSEYQNLPKLALKQSEKTRKKSQPLSESKRRRSADESKDPENAVITMLSEILSCICSGSGC
jgi:hypothetical protein